MPSFEIARDGIMGGGHTPRLARRAEFNEEGMSQISIWQLGCQGVRPALSALPNHFYCVCVMAS